MRVIQQKWWVGRKKEGGVLHFVMNDYQFSEQEALKVNEYKILKYVFLKKRKGRLLG